MTTVALQPQDIPDPHDRAFLGHPRGLAYLAFTEAWERFSYYGMQALLVLYMVKQLLTPGHIEKIIGFPALHAVLGPHLSGQALASVIFGTYTSLVYLTPILGGLLADRVLGRTRTVALGALLMSAGHFLMAFDQSFLLALLCLVLGVGCFKGNIASQVGGLYAPGDLRRADAFQIFFLAINAGVIAAPLIAGTLGERVGWHYGFGAAGVGMVLGLIIYLAGRKHLPPDPILQRGPRAERPKLGQREGVAVAVLLALLPVLAIAALCNQQIFNAYLVWAERSADFTLFGQVVPTTWLITLDAVVSVSFLAGVALFWRLWKARFPEPDEVTKITIGCFISVTGCLALAAGAAIAAATGTKVALAWLIAFHVLNSIGFANIFPVGLALYSRAAPAAIAATIIGVYYLHLFAANWLVGQVGTLLEQMPATQFWLMHAAFPLVAGVIFLIARVAAGRVLAPQA